ncbi:hypothetical protein [Actinoplanes sp. NPDC049265]|uniref:hypothetical protein n=1 Tax=Actinoplanes sp. NPDC049265 TaxID=3363902 RepID=UPI0037231A75
MSVSDDLPPPRRPLFFPVVIATTFLCIIGISAGILLANDRDRREALNPVNNTPDVGTSQSTGVQPETSQPSETPTLNGEPCRQETLDAAAKAGYPGPLVIVVHIKTERSDVYICKDGSGHFFYHANKIGNQGDEWVEGETALFVDDVQRRSKDYLATANDGTTLSVNKDRLLITHHNDGRKETQPALS